MVEKYLFRALRENSNTKDDIVASKQTSEVNKYDIRRHIQFGNSLDSSYLSFTGSIHKAIALALPKFSMEVKRPDKYIEYVTKFNRSEVIMINKEDLQKQRIEVINPAEILDGIIKGYAKGMQEMLIHNVLPKGRYRVVPWEVLDLIELMERSGNLASEEFWDTYNKDKDKLLNMVWESRNYIMTKEIWSKLTAGEKLFYINYYALKNSNYSLAKSIYEENMKKDVEDNITCISPHIIKFNMALWQKGLLEKIGEEKLGHKISLGIPLDENFLLHTDFESFVCSEANYKRCYRLREGYKESKVKVVYNNAYNKLREQYNRESYLSGLYKLPSIEEEKIVFLNADISEEEFLENAIEVAKKDCTEGAVLLTHLSQSGNKVVEIYGDLTNINMDDLEIYRKSDKNWVSLFARGIPHCHFANNQGNKSLLNY